MPGTKAKIIPIRYEHETIHGFSVKVNTHIAEPVKSDVPAANDHVS